MEARGTERDRDVDDRQEEVRQKKVIKEESPILYNMEGTRR